MTSEYYKQHQQKFTRLIEGALYPKGEIWTEVANYVKAHPEQSHYTLSELEERIGKRGYSMLTAVLRLSMAPYNLFETTFKLCDVSKKVINLNLHDYQKCVLNGGYRLPEGELLPLETVNKHLIIQMKILSHNSH